MPAHTAVICCLIFSDLIDNYRWTTFLSAPQRRKSNGINSGEGADHETFYTSIWANFIEGGLSWLFIGVFYLSNQLILTIKISRNIDIMLRCVCIIKAWSNLVLTMKNYLFIQKWTFAGINPVMIRLQFHKSKVVIIVL